MSNIKAFYRIKRDNICLWVEMFTDEKFPYRAARRPILKRSEAVEAFREFINGLGDE